MTELQLHAPAPQRGAAWVGAVAGLLVILVAAGLTMFALRSLNAPGVPLRAEVAPGDRLADPGTSPAFVAPEGHFRADFPAPPERIVEPIPAHGRDLKMVGYAVEVKGTAYMAAFANLPKVAPITEANLEEAAASAAAGGEMLGSSLTRHQGHSAVEFKMKEDGQVGRGLLVLTPRRLYIVIVGGKAQSPRPYRSFVEKFKILERT